MGLRFGASSVTTEPPRPLSLLNYLLRFAQFVLGVTVIGLYATDIAEARRTPGAKTQTKWTFAVVVATLSALSSLVYCIPVGLIRGFAYWVWDWCLFILWTAVFGTFAKLYLHAEADVRGPKTLRREKNAVWIDLTNLILWLFTALMATIAFFSLQRGRSLHTGRAVV